MIKHLHLKIWGRIDTEEYQKWENAHLTTKHEDVCWIIKAKADFVYFTCF